MNYSHDFVKPATPFHYRFRKCVYCKKVKIFKAAYKCRDCRKVCHRKCHETFVEMEVKCEEQLEVNMKSTIEMSNNNEVVKRTPHQYCKKKRELESLDVNNLSITVPEESTSSLNELESQDINNLPITVTKESTSSLNVIELPNINNLIINIPKESTSSLNELESLDIDNQPITEPKAITSSINELESPDIVNQPITVPKEITSSINELELPGISNLNKNIPEESTSSLNELESPNINYLSITISNELWDAIKKAEDEETSKNSILDEIIAQKCVHEIEENVGNELREAEIEHYKAFLQTSQDPNTSLAVKILQDVQQIESSGVAPVQENFTMEEKKDISAVSADIQYETGSDLNANELENVVDGQSQKKSFWRRIISFRKPKKHNNLNINIANELCDEIQKEEDDETSKNSILDEIIAQKCVHEIEENVGNELREAEIEHYKAFLQTSQDPNTSLAVKILQDVQQIDSNGVVPVQEYFTMEENKDISAVSADIQYETGSDLNANELENVVDGRSQKNFLEKDNTIPETIRDQIE